VAALSVHPSGKLALSVGAADRSLKTWNLIKGRSGFITNLHGTGDAVAWSPDGGYYAVSVANRIDVYSVQTAKVKYSFPWGKGVNRILFPNVSSTFF
jgi:protein MAK11